MNIREQINPKFQARKKLFDRIASGIFMLCGFISAIMIVLIIYFVGQKGIQVFLPGYPERQGLREFLTGTSWRPESNTFGAGFIIVNTLISAFGAALLAFPISTLSALFIVKIAPKRLRDVFTTVVELLAAVPSVVYGVFAAGALTDLVNRLAVSLGFSTRGGLSMLTVILLLTIMVYPTMTSLAISAIRAVPEPLELGSLALGASTTQTNFKVVLSSAKSGIFAGLVLGLGRAFGEATAVSMVAGNSMIGPTWNPFEITRTLTSTMLTGMHETTGVGYDIRFSIGIVLMVIIIITNWLIHLIRRKIGGVGND